MKAQHPTFRSSRGLGRGGMVKSITNTLPESAADRVEWEPWEDERVLEQWERVSLAWGNDFAAYLRYMGYRDTERG